MSAESDMWLGEGSKKEEKGKTVQSRRLTSRIDEMAAYNEKLRRDLEESRKENETLKKQHFFLQSVFDALPTPIFAKDSSGVYTMVNESYEELHGREKKDVIGRTVHQIYPERLAEKYTEMDRALTRQTDRIQRYDFEIIDSRCGAREVTKFKAALYDPEGQYQGLVGVIFDITEHKLTERAILQAKEEWEKTFNALPDLICIIDQDFTVTQANQAMAERLGIGLEEMIGRTCYQLIVKRDKPCKSCPLIRRNSIHHTHAFETKLEYLSGDFIISITPLGGTENGAGGWVFIAREITKRKQAEVALRKAHAELEKRVKERTAELASLNDELKNEVAQRKAAEEMVKSRLMSLTSPGKIPDHISYTDLFMVEELQTIQDAFAEATNVASIITHPDGRPITEPSRFCRLCQDFVRPSEKGLCNCIRSDALIGRPNPGGPILRHCLSVGLWDGGASITVGDKHIASWLAGQVRDESLTEEKVRRYAREIGADEDEMAAALEEVPFMPREQFEKICHALFLIANQMSQLALQNVLQARFIIERKRSQKALLKSEARLQQLSAKLIMAQEEERKRLAGELHDGIGQSLTAAKYGIDSVRQSMPIESYFTETLSTSSEILKKVIHEVRRMQTELRPQVLDDLGIVATVNWFCREYQTIYSRISVEKHIRISEDVVADTLKPVIYRIIQEALNNVAKHSGATKVFMQLEQVNGSIQLDILDNGLGFDVSGTMASHNEMIGLGLDSMKERADLSGGAFTIDSRPGTGTKIRVVWPL